MEKNNDLSELDIRKKLMLSNFKVTKYILGVMPISENSRNIQSLVSKFKMEL